MVETETKAKSKAKPRARAPAIPKEPLNPDEEVATKGFVKCVGRKVLNHHHKKTCDGGTASLVLITVGIIALFFMVLDSALRHIPNVPEWAYWIIVAVTVSKMISVLDANEEGDGLTFNAPEDRDLDPYKRPNTFCEDEC